MPTVVSTGEYASSDTRGSTTAAVMAAVQSLQGKEAQLGFVFASPRHELRNVLTAARLVAPKTQFFGCSTAGQFTERGVSSGGVCVMLLASDEIEHVIAGPHDIADIAAARDLVEPFALAQGRATSRGFRDSTTVLLGDGVVGTFEKVVQEIRKQTRPHHQIVGGAAGDDGAFKATFVGALDRAANRSAVALHVFGAKPWGVAVDHGIKPASEKMMITKATGNLVEAINDRQPDAVYAEYARKVGLPFTRETTSRFLMENPLGVYQFEELTKVRTPLSMNDNGALFCAGDVPIGSTVCIVSCEADGMLTAARRAARDARKALGENRAAGVLVFDCICRGSLLGTRFSREIEVVREVFPSTPVCGFLSYGEVARFKGKMDGYHNSSIVVVAIPR